MIDQLPPELFAERPVRSEYQPPKGKSVTKRRIFLVGGIAVILLGSIMVVDHMISAQESEVAMIPHIESKGAIKERPEQPGGIDIPHRDVAVFQQLDNKTTQAEEEKVEQLLPQAEEPEMEATGEQVVASMANAVTESLEAELNKAAETLPPPVTEAVIDGEEETLLEKAVEVPAEKTVKQDAQEAIKTKVVEPVQKEIQEAVKKAEKTMKVDAAPDPVPAPKPKAVVKKVEKKAKKVVKKTKKAAAKPKESARLPSDLFTKTESTVKKVSGKTMRTQLGSFRSQDMARKAAEVISKKHASDLSGYTLNVVRADLGAKGIYYLLLNTFSNPRSPGGTPILSSSWKKKKKKK